jgi:tyrosyl-tRNA synthetase
VTGSWDDLVWRGLVHQSTDPEQLSGLLDAGGLVAYVGFDPSAPSLQIGNLVGICTLRRLQRAGHKVIYLAGGATGMIGDPGGKSTERNLLTADEVKANVAAVRAQLERLLEPGAELLDNGDWLSPMTLLDFLRDVGKHFTVNSMVAKESVRARFEDRAQGISYTEFSYMLLQAADYLHLFDTRGCRLQLGGSDQWGNIVSGVDLVRRVRGEQVHALTWPLVTDDHDRKLGKTETGTIWLDAERTSPYALYQYLVRSSDDRVGAYLRVFTFLERAEIEALDQTTADHPERREAQRALAFEVTALVHGEDDAAKARRASEVLFSEEIAELDEATLLSVFADAPSSTFGREPVSVVDALLQTGLAPSRSQARRFAEQRAVYVNNRQVDDPDLLVDPVEHGLHDRFVVLRRGKKEQALLRFEV